MTLKIIFLPKLSKKNHVLMKMSISESPNMPLKKVLLIVLNCSAVALTADNITEGTLLREGAISPHGRTLSFAHA